jgi:hypothetical protein
MSLYLCAFDGDYELAGVDVGSYETFGDFRKAVAQLVWMGITRGELPLLLDHPDGDGEWAVADLPALRDELERLQGKPAAERFEDTEGQPLVDALIALVSVAEEHGVPVLFQ